MIRPARNFAEGHHIIVALRNMKDADGNVIAGVTGVREVP